MQAAWLYCGMGGTLQKTRLVLLKTVKVMGSKNGLRNCLEQKRLKSYANYCVLDRILEQKKHIGGKTSEIWKKKKIWSLVDSKAPMLVS